MVLPQVLTAITISVDYYHKNVLFHFSYYNFKSFYGIKFLLLRTSVIKSILIFELYSKLQIFVIKITRVIEFFPLVVAITSLY